MEEIAKEFCLLLVELTIVSEFLRSVLLKIYIIRQLILVRIVIITVSSKCFSGEFDFYGDFFFFFFCKLPLRSC